MRIIYVDRIRGSIGLFVGYSLVTSLLSFSMMKIKSRSSAEADGDQQHHLGITENHK